MCVALADVSFCHRVEVGIVIPRLRHGLGHLVGGNLHRSQGVSVRALVTYENKARVCPYNSMVGILDILEGIQVKGRQRSHLCHVVGCEVSTCFWVSYLSDDTIVGLAKYRIGH